MEVDVRAGLQKLAERLGGEGARLTEAQRLSGGASMETWAFGFEGKGGFESLILRRRSVPFDEETARSVSLATEAALIRATEANGARVPSVRHVCDAADGLGEAYVMVRVDGETLGRKITSDPRFDAVRERARSRSCTRQATPSTTMPWSSPRSSDAGCARGEGGELASLRHSFADTVSARPDGLGAAAS